MKPEVARKYPMGQKVHALPDPVWVMEPDAMRGHGLLCASPGMGGFITFSRPTRRKNPASYFKNRRRARPEQPAARVHA